jgi:hypothetical protein
MTDKYDGWVPPVERLLRGVKTHYVRKPSTPDYMDGEIVVCAGSGEMWIGTQEEAEEMVRGSFPGHRVCRLSYYR